MKANSDQLCVLKRALKPGNAQQEKLTLPFPNNTIENVKMPLPHVQCFLLFKPPCFKKTAKMSILSVKLLFIFCAAPLLHHVDTVSVK
jgi:hypothetical protein